MLACTIFGNPLPLDKLCYMVSKFILFVGYFHVHYYIYCVHKFYSQIFIFTFIGCINLPEPVVLPGDTSGVPVPCFCC